MSQEFAVSLNQVAKKYKLYDRLHHRLFELFHPFQKKYHHDFWALDGISIRVPKGKTVGIIGRNGSGKSTLLQIISGVLQPSAGSLRVNGRISALLELGAGFNPEFTGRDNALFYGRLMGFSADEVKEKLPAIQQFADIGDFFDQPVKIYSSGMFVRLAFAAAIHVDPDILIVDEALAVGDAKFQHKCYQKFLEFQKLGKTIILVTHDVNAVVKHCDEAFLLEGGKIAAQGDPQTVVNSYLNLMFTGKLERAVTGDENKTLDPKGAVPSEVQGSNAAGQAAQYLEHFLKSNPDRDACPCRRSYNKNEYRYGDRRAEILDYLIVSEGEADPVRVKSGCSVDLYVKIKFNERVANPMTGFGIKTVDGVEIFGISTRSLNVVLPPGEAQSVVVFKWSAVLSLAPGDFFMDVGCAEYVNGDSPPLDRRYGLAHVTVDSDTMHGGFVRFDTKFEQVVGSKAAGQTVCI